MRATKAPKEGIATSQRVGQQRKGDGDLDTNGPLSSIIQKSGSGRRIVLLTTGDPACGPDTGRCVTTEEPQKVSWAGWLQGGGTFSCSVFLNPASRLPCKHTVTPTHTPETSVHISLHPDPATQAPPPSEPRYTETPNNNNNNSSTQKRYFHTCDFI